MSCAMRDMSNVTPGSAFHTHTHTHTHPYTRTRTRTHAHTHTHTHTHTHLDRLEVLVAVRACPKLRVRVCARA